MMSQEQAPGGRPKRTCTQADLTPEERRLAAPAGTYSRAQREYAELVQASQESEERKARKRAAKALEVAADRRREAATKRTLLLPGVILDHEPRHPHSSDETSPYKAKRDRAKRVAAAQLDRTPSVQKRAIKDAALEAAVDVPSDSEIDEFLANQKHAKQRPLGRGDSRRAGEAAGLSPPAGSAKKASRKRATKRKASVSTKASAVRRTGKKAKASAKKAAPKLKTATPAKKKRGAGGKARRAANASEEEEGSSTDSEDETEAQRQQKIFAKLPQVDRKLWEGIKNTTTASRKRAADIIVEIDAARRANRKGLLPEGYAHLIRRAVGDVSKETGFRCTALDPNPETNLDTLKTCDFDVSGNRVRK